MWICLHKMWLLYESNVGITARKAFVFRTVNFLLPGIARRVQTNTQYQQATPLDCHTGFLSVSPPAACQGESLKPLKLKDGETGGMKNVIHFIAGVFVGSVIGVSTMCILQVNKKIGRSQQ